MTGPRTRSLRRTTLAIVVATTLALVLGICLPLRSHVLERFSAIERQLATSDLMSARNTVGAEAEALGAMARDYAVWDETHAFVTAGDPEYVARNFADSTFAENRIGLVAVLDRGRAVRFDAAYDLAADVRGEAPPLVSAIPEELLDARDAGAHGLLGTGSGLWLLGLHPVARSDGSDPAVGTMILGRALDAPEVARLAERIDLDVRVSPLSGALPDDVAARRGRIEALGPEEPLLDPLDDSTLGAYALVRDVADRPVAVLSVRVPRTVYLQGRADANFIAGSVGLACLAFGLMILLLLDRFIVRRVTHLGSEVGEVAIARDHSLRVSVSGEDELGRLARTVNEMLASLERLNVELDDERAKAERLLRNVLPEPIAERLKDGEQTIADAFDEVSVLFADIVGFTDLSAKVPATELVVLLNEVFSAFDALAEKHGLEKIKTIGDAYMVVAGLPARRPDHAVALATMALDMLDAVAAFNAKHQTSLDMRIGINSGPVVAGVIGKKKFIYDLWGDAVNTASRMESSGVAGRVQVSASTAKLLDGALAIEDRGVIAVKGKGEMQTFLLTPRPRAGGAAQST